MKELEFLYLKNDYFRPFKEGERLRNDIVKVTFEDNSSEYRIYINNKAVYVVIPFDDLMFSEISQKTWTIDSNLGEINNFVKSDKDNDNLGAVLNRYEFNKNDYKLFSLKRDKVLDKLYQQKRKEFTMQYPLANTSEPM
ncbi:hypothetical protein R3379_22235 [Bacillus sp. BAU-SS-2023]|nr:hypothetical protein [Bacillus sp. BAU-SS-2023]